MLHYKLYYFDVRAFGETIRQIFAYTETPYEDVRIPRDEWPAVKPEMPFHHLPVLEEDGVQMPQSWAIARYLARQHGLAGKTPREEFWVDAIADQFKDFFKDITVYTRYLTGTTKGDKEQALKEFGEPARDEFYPLLEKRLSESKSGFLVGDGLTWVDFTISDYTFTLYSGIPQFYDKYPKIVAHMNKIRAIPQIAAWIEKRPKTLA